MTDGSESPCVMFTFGASDMVHGVSTTQVLDRRAVDALLLMSG